MQDSGRKPVVRSIGGIKSTDNTSSMIQKQEKVNVNLACGDLESPVPSGLPHVIDEPVNADAADEEEVVKYFSIMGSLDKTSQIERSNISDEESDQPTALAPIKPVILSKHGSDRNRSGFEKTSERSSRRNTTSTITKNVIASYARIIGTRNPKKTVGEDPKTTVTTIGSLKNRLFSLVAGESAEERQVTKRLDWYKRLLQSEISLLKRSIQRFSEHSKSLIKQFESQEQQIQTWGLAHVVLKAFRMQAWARVSRSFLVEDLASVAEEILKSRSERANNVIEQFQADKKSPAHKYSLSSYDDFCLKIDDVLAKDPTYVDLSTRVFRMDRVCASATKIFHPLFPQLDPKQFEQRKGQLESILVSYAEFLAHPEPEQLDKDMNWVEFCEWYVGRSSSMRALEAGYASIIEDERERDGRLFRRWCTLVLDSLKPGAPGATNIDTSANAEESRSPTRPDAPVNDNGVIEAAAELQGSAAETIPPPPADSMSPKCIKAFVSYYAVNVVGAHFGISANLMNAAIVLTQQVVYRRISSVVFRNDTPSVRARDVLWRRQCHMLRFADPIAIGAPSEYVYGFKRKTQTDDQVKELIDECIKREEVAARLQVAAEASLKGEHFYKPLKVASRFQVLSRAREATVERLKLGAPIYGSPYARTSQVFSWLSSTVVPHELCSILLLAQKWLLKDAIAVSKKVEYLGADAVFPITVIALAEAGIPDMHLILHFLNQYGHFEQQSGEVSYYLTCLQAAVEFIMSYQLPPDRIEKYCFSSQDDEILNAKKLLDAEVNDGVAAKDAVIEGDGDIEKLGQWLRFQESMEDTISILQKEGWMA